MTECRDTPPGGSVTTCVTRASQGRVKGSCVTAPGTGRGRAPQGGVQLRPVHRARVKGNHVPPQEEGSYVMSKECEACQGTGRDVEDEDAQCWHCMGEGLVMTICWLQECQVCHQWHCPLHDKLCQPSIEEEE